MKTRFLFISAFLFVALLTSSLRASDPVYLNVISNSSKTIDYTVGVYPLTIKNEPENDRTTISMYLLNNGSKRVYSINCVKRGKLIDIPSLFKDNNKLCHNLLPTGNRLISFKNFTLY